MLDTITYFLYNQFNAYRKFIVNASFIGLALPGFMTNMMAPILELTQPVVFATETAQEIVTESTAYQLPVAADREIKTIKYVNMTAYNSEPGQTDDTPCITANNFNVCEHGTENIIATNALPFETRVQFPDLFGDKVFIVKDRMNRRYTTRVDIWMINRSDALKFGLKHNVKMVVLD
jgi:3D (Asp-Asp-Asp) domain-containing protein